MRGFQVQPGFNLTMGGVAVDRAVYERMKAESRLKSKKCIKLSLTIHICVEIVINALVWGIWASLDSLQRGGSYVWPKWVSFGSVVLILGHFLAVMPLLMMKSGQRCCPRWLWVVFFEAVLANIVCVIVYYAVRSTQCAAGGIDCVYMWPWWVFGGSSVMVIATCLIGVICSNLYGTNYPPYEFELQDELQYASSDEEDGM
mmetsp:Transcript_53380/g.95812  ORF Transcript_53380/g.95812 Transcript_53380/m.95812 type:complete len:201 (-) Transcript_53380:101-703(-)|eukprot:CAMPEP_0197664814 /NCGR_PEP_ID=MMETSP1338-20131121/58869_1 /TAXON_ID=43686 ORGANISM="Pelagodinium beii, Strain RCC1491" /NCGR_SAMPLE_ID=MMETSP1338 /ASSEMBLY_ACC=CAM_ASM_000754 /LENGTH=200 /DNA_ID=CAMNT_0043243531 /DNA_START=109 /DNA_END=711 /DNA_ORIENTATION=+